MTLELADHLQASGNKARFSALTQDQLRTALDELAATLDAMEASGASCSPASGFDTVSGLHQVVSSLIK
jgi:hypothetical protein